MLFAYTEKRNENIFKMTTKFTLRFGTRSINPSSKSEAVVARKYTNAKNKKLAEAVAWCKDNNERGHCDNKSTFG